MQPSLLSLLLLLLLLLHSRCESPEDECIANVRVHRRVCNPLCLPVYLPSIRACVWSLRARDFTTVLSRQLKFCE